MIAEGFGWLYLPVFILLYTSIDDREDETGHAEEGATRDGEGGVGLVAGAFDVGVGGVEVFDFDSFDLTRGDGNVEVAGVLRLCRGCEVYRYR